MAQDIIARALAAKGGGGGQPIDAYTKAETDTLLSKKENTIPTYTLAEYEAVKDTIPPGQKFIITDDRNPFEEEVENARTGADGIVYDDLKERLDTEYERLSEMELFKFPNATIIGSPTINNGQISGFSAENYMKFPFIVNMQGRPFVIDIAFTTGADITNQQNIIDGIDHGIAFAIRSSKFVLVLGSTSGNWDISQGEKISNVTVTPGTTYRVRISWDGSVYKFEYSTDGETYTEDTAMRVTSSLSLYPTQINIGVTAGLLGAFKGIINMNYCSLTISNKVVWTGMDDVGLATRMAIDMSNIDEAGENKVLEIVEEQIAGKANAEDVYTKQESDEALDELIVNDESKATPRTKIVVESSGETFEVPTVDEVYAKTEIDHMIKPVLATEKLPMYRFPIEHEVYGNLNFSGIVGGLAYNGTDRIYLATHDNKDENVKIYEYEYPITSLTPIAVHDMALTSHCNNMQYLNGYLYLNGCHSDGTNANKLYVINTSDWSYETVEFQAATTPVSGYCIMTMTIDGNKMLLKYIRNSGVLYVYNCNNNIGIMPSFAVGLPESGDGYFADMEAVKNGFAFMISNTNNAHNFNGIILSNIMCTEYYYAVIDKNTAEIEGCTLLSQTGSNANWLVVDSNGEIAKYNFGTMSFNNFTSNTLMTYTTNLGVGIKKIYTMAGYKTQSTEVSGITEKFPISHRRQLHNSVLKFRCGRYRKRIVEEHIQNSSEFCVHFTDFTSTIIDDIYAYYSATDDYHYQLTNIFVRHKVLNGDETYYFNKSDALNYLKSLGTFELTLLNSSDNLFFRSQDDIVTNTQAAVLYPQ